MSTSPRLVLLLVFAICIYSAVPLESQQQPAFGKYPTRIAGLPRRAEASGGLCASDFSR